MGWKIKGAGIQDKLVPEMDAGFFILHVVSIIEYSVYGVLCLVSILWLTITTQTVQQCKGILNHLRQIGTFLEANTIFSANTWNTEVLIKFIKSIVLKRFIVFPICLTIIAP